MSLAAALGLAAISGCEQPQTAVVCHNANCAAPVDPSRDDTLEALSESLALEYDGRPLLDGVEIDLLWSAAGATCSMAHDFGQSDPTPALDAAAELASYLGAPGPVTFGGGSFYVKLELRPEVDAGGRGHTDSEAMAHAQCALDVEAVIRATGRDVEIYFDSRSADVLVALRAHPAWSDDSYASAAFSAGIFAGGAGLDDFESAPDAVSMHPDWVSRGMLATVRATGAQLTLWTRTLGARQLRAIRDLEPVFVSTGDAELLRRRLSR